MRKVWLLFPFISGCFLFSNAEKSHVEKTPEEDTKEKLFVPPTYDTHVYGPVRGYQVGQWATFKIVKSGVTTTTTIAVVGREGDSVWIEVIDEGEERQVSARRVSPKGAVDKAYYRVIPAKGEASAVYIQTIEQYSETESPSLQARNRDVKDEQLKVGEQSMTVKAVKVDFEESSGRRVTEQTWWSKAVPPLYDGSDEGGLVRKVTADLTVDLIAFGSDAKPLIELNH